MHIALHAPRASMSPRSCPPSPPIPPDADPDELLARFAKALAHPARVRILRLVLERDECVAGGIAQELPLAQSTVSQHLKVLREVGLLQGEVDGASICYCANLEALERFRDLLDQMREPVHG